MEKLTLPISIVMGLNRQTSGLELSRFIVESCNPYLPGIEVSVLEVYGCAGKTNEHGAADTSNMVIRRFDDAIYPRPQKFDENGLDLAIGRKKPTLAEAATGGCRLIVPTVSEIGPMRLILFDRLSQDPYQRLLALQIAELYEHQIRLMDHLERDQLTGLLNRQTFNQFFQDNLQRAHANQQKASLAVLDIDHFKRVNDNFGHLFGDEVLLHFAQIMERTFRFNDPLFRFGGEEFVVLLSARDRHGFETALQRFRNTIENYHFPGVGRVTVSIGCAEYGNNELPTSVIDRADQALYHAKENGRNRVTLHEDIADQFDSAMLESEIDLF